MQKQNAYPYGIQKYRWTNDGMQPWWTGQYYLVADVKAEQEDSEIEFYKEQISELEYDKTLLESDKAALEERVAKLENALDDIQQTARRASY